MYTDPTGHENVYINGMTVSFQPSSQEDQEYVRYLYSQTKKTPKIKHESYYLLSFNMNKMLSSDDESYSPSNIAISYPELYLAYYQMQFGDPLFTKAQMAQFNINYDIYKTKLNELTDAKNIFAEERNRLLAERFNQRVGNNFKNWGYELEGFFRGFCDNPFKQTNDLYNNARGQVLNFCMTPTGEMLDNFSDDINSWGNSFINTDDYGRVDMLGDLTAEGTRQLMYAAATDGMLGGKNIFEFSADDFFGGGRGTGGKYLSKPATENGTLNIGARGKVIDGAYNIDIDPQSTGVYKGDAYNLSNIKTGSQSKIIIENPWEFDPLNPEVTRVLADEGEIIITGSRSNMNKIVKTLDERGLEIKGRNTVINDGSYTQTNGSPIKSDKLDQYIIVKKK